ncbi:MAG TPA: DUF2975 domain-containing protein [Candidatus Saccharimonadales bacterium]
MTTMKKLPLDRTSTLLLRAAVVAVGAIVLALCIFALPAVFMAAPEEYNDAATHAIYAIIGAMYMSAVPFFYGLYQAMRILHFIDKNKAFSELSVNALKRITFCALAISVVYAVSLPLFYIWAQHEDAPGLIIIGMVLSAAPFAIGVAAAVLRRLLQEAISIKSENDLTV